MLVARSGRRRHKNLIAGRDEAEFFHFRSTGLKHRPLAVVQNFHSRVPVVIPPPESQLNYILRAIRRVRTSDQADGGGRRVGTSDVCGLGTSVEPGATPLMTATCFRPAGRCSSVQIKANPSPTFVWRPVFGLTVAGRYPVETTNRDGCTT